MVPLYQIGAGGPPGNAPDRALEHAFHSTCWMSPQPAWQPTVRGNGSPQDWGFQLCSACRRDLPVSRFHVTMDITVHVVLPVHCIPDFLSLLGWHNGILVRRFYGTSLPSDPWPSWLLGVPRSPCCIVSHAVRIVVIALARNLILVDGQSGFCWFLPLKLKLT